MKNFYFVALFATLVLLGGCSKENTEGGEVAAAQAELSISLPVGISRTAIDENGRASWTEGDTFALWSENRTGGFNHNGVKFQMMYYWHSAQSAVFTSNANQLAEGEYTYYAVSPMPASIDGRKATFNLPAEQQGSSFNGAYDIMVASPISAKALSTERVNNLALDFQHKMHTLKVSIAKNDLGIKIGKLRFVFPTPVTGSITVDANNPEAEIAFASGSNEMTINCGEGVDEGDTVWGVIVPQSISGVVQVVAIGTDGRLSLEKEISLSKDCLAGHITPLSLSVPSGRSTLRFSIGANNLGESINKLTITDHYGYALPLIASGDNTYDYSVASSASSVFELYEGKTFTATFESNNAIVSKSFTMPSMLSSGVNTIPALTVPYLFFEDFSSLHTSYEFDDARKANDSAIGGHLLNSYMSVAGWNVARSKGVAGQSVRVNVRHQSTLGVTRSNGRLDTPPMSQLKSGASVKLKVTFDMGAYVDSGYNSANEMFVMAGIHSNDPGGALNGLSNTRAFGNVSSDTERAPRLFSTTSYQSDYLPVGYNANSFNSTFPTYSFTQEGCNSTTRFCWVPCCVQTMVVEAQNACYYLYFDNIKVSIEQ